VGLGRRARNTERCQVVAIPWADRRPDVLERTEMSTHRWVLPLTAADPEPKRAG
jgi:hypothetical protein